MDKGAKGEGVANRLQVLVIDDNADERRTIRRHLSPFAEVQEADTGAHGVDLLRERAFDCVFVGERLPDMEGTALLQTFYDIGEDLMPAPFVMVATRASEDGMAEALRWGAHDYIVKDDITASVVGLSLWKAREVLNLKKSRRSAEEKWLQAQKMDAVAQLASGIAHDFNNMLTAVLGNTRLMRRRLKEMPEAQGAPIASKVDAVENAASRGSDLMRDLMVFSRQQELKPEAVEIGAAMRRVFGALERVPDSRIKLTLDAQAAIGMVKVDAALLESAAVHIARNAAAAMPQGGTLAVAAASCMFHGTEHVLITFTDTGTGMAEHVRIRIFEPFYTTRAAGQGTGLGLAMVHGFIRQSGGHIEAESELGQGTAIRIYLPAYKTTATKEIEDGP